MEDKNWEDMTDFERIEVVWNSVVCGQGKQVVEQVENFIKNCTPEENEVEFFGYVLLDKLKEHTDDNTAHYRYAHIAKKYFANKII